MSCGSSHEPSKLCLEADCMSCLQDLTFQGSLRHNGLCWKEQRKVLLQGWCLPEWDQPEPRAGAEAALLGAPILMGPPFRAAGDAPQVTPQVWAQGQQHCGAGGGDSQDPALLEATAEHVSCC